jgi:hypothetical protein
MKKIFNVKVVFLNLLFGYSLWLLNAHSVWNPYIYVPLGLLFIAINSYCFFFNKKASDILLFFSTIFLFFILSESFLNYIFGNSWDEKTSRTRILKSLVTGKKYDNRTPLDVVFEKNKLDKNIFNFIAPMNFIVDNKFYDKADQKILPLSGIANVETVYCNENGDYLIYKSDRYGFNNKDSMYEEYEGIAFGDSFVHGACVKPESNMISLISKSGKYTLNLGNGGNGPLLNIALFQEIREELKPKKVLWFFYEGNDLTDLDIELKNEHLKKYLDDSNFNTKQFKIKNDIDSYLKTILEKEKNEFIKKKVSVFMKIIRLNIFIALFTSFDSSPKKVQIRIDISAEKLLILEKIINRANSISKQLGAKFYFIYLPEYFRYKLDYKNFAKDKILEALKKNNITVIDIEKTVSSFEKPLKFFPFEEYGHYNNMGYQFVADEIVKQLK